MTIIVPVFNGAHVLDLTVPAVLRQPAESIVYVDDGSTDGTGDVLRRLTGPQDRVTVLRHPTNRGRAAARNTGIVASRGDTLVFLDADIAPHPGYGEAITDALRQPGVVAAVGRLDVSHLDPADPYHQYLAWGRRGAPDHDGPADWRYFLSGVAAVRREALDIVGRFPSQIPYGEDLALACRLAERYPAGLRAVPDARATMYDAGNLSSAQAKLAEFARSLPRLRSMCPDALSLAGLDALESSATRDRLAVRLARLQAPARFVQSALPSLPRTIRRWAVRYLLAHTLAAHAPDALLDAPQRS